jgi:hypothetical protein
MDSVRTKAKSYIQLPTQQCVAEIIVLVETYKMVTGFRIYVAWEWKDMADRGVYGLAKSRTLYPIVTEDNIYNAMDQGYDIGGTEEANNIFKHIL